MKEVVSPRTAGELLDVVDIFGEPVGQVLDKRTIHEQGIRHRDVHVWITNGSGILQQRRNFDKPIMPGEWDISVGGHVGAGRAYIDDAIKETQEELGITLPSDRFIRIGRIASLLQFPGWEHPHNIVGENYAVFAPELSLGDLQLQDEEVMDARWYPIDQLATDLMHPDTAAFHAPQPRELYALGIAGVRGLLAR